MSLKELFKNWRTRMAGLSLVGALLVLADESFKEGYVFNPADLFNLAITHEKLFLVFVVLGLVLGVRRRR